MVDQNPTINNGIVSSNIQWDDPTETENESTIEWSVPDVKEGDPRPEDITRQYTESGVDWGYEPEGGSTMNIRTEEEKQGMAGVIKDVQTAGTIAAGTIIEQGGALPMAVEAAKATPGGWQTKTAVGVGTFLFSLYAGSKARTELGLERVSDLDPEDQPYGRFIETTTASLLPGAYIQRLGLMGTRFVEGSIVDTMLLTAKRNPKMFLAGETSAAVMSGAGGYAAVQQGFSPDDPRVAAWEIITPVATQFMTQSALKAAPIIQAQYAKFSPQAKYSQAGKTIEMFARHFEEDPTFALNTFKKLAETDPYLAETLTLSQATDSDFLKSIDSYLRKYVKSYGPKADEAIKKAREHIGLQIAAVSRIKDPEALRTAAKLERDFMISIVEDRLNVATREAHEAAARIASENIDFRPGSKAFTDTSKEIRKILGEAISDSRQVERELWSQVDQTLKIGDENEVNNFINTFRQLKGEISEFYWGEQIPKQAKEFFKKYGIREVSGETTPQIEGLESTQLLDVGEDISNLTTKDLIQIRSGFLASVRKFSSGTSAEFDLARVYGKLADSILSDLDIIYKDAGDISYEKARNFSRDFNDTFRRSFVGEITATGTSLNRDIPEVLANKLTLTGKDLTASRLRDLENASRFLFDQTNELSQEVKWSTMMDLQHQMVRLLADDIGVVKGTVDGAKIRKPALEKFLENNQDLMDNPAFSSIKKAITDAIDSEIGRSNLKSLITGDKTQITSKYRQLVGQDPLKLATTVINSPNQSDAVRKFVQDGIALSQSAALGDITPQEVINSTRTALMTAIFKKSMRKDTMGGQEIQLLDLNKLRTNLHTPSIIGDDGPLEIMYKEGLYDQDSYNAIIQLLDTAERINLSQLDVIPIDVEPHSGMTDYITRAGARIAGSFAVKTGAQAAGSGSVPITAYGAGAKVGEQLLAATPKQQQLILISEFMANPNQMVMDPFTGIERKISDVLFDAVGTGKAAIGKMSMVNGWLISKGIHQIGQTMQGMDRFFETGEENIQWNEPLEETSTLQ